VNQKFSDLFKDPESRKTWLEIAAFSIGAVILYELGFLIIIFLVPIQILYIRHGEKALLSSGVFILLAISLVNVVQAEQALGEDLTGNLLLLDLLLPAALLAGLYIINTYRLNQFDRTIRFIFAAVLIGIVSVPIVLYFAQSEVLNNALRLQVETFREVLTVQPMEEGAEAVSSVPPAEELIAYAKNIFFSSYIFVYTLYLMVNWYIGVLFSARSNYGQDVNAPDITQYHVEDRFVWPLIGAWTLVLLSQIQNLGALEYAFWNAGLILLLFFALQGIGILRYLMIKKNISTGLRIVIVLGLVVLILIPGVNIAVIVGIPLLGVSEIWIKYRMEQRS
jgi:hypothetical protein